MPQPTNKSLIEDYYKTSGLKKIPKGTKRGDVLKDEELFQLYKTPKKDKGNSAPHIDKQDIEPKAILQADLIYLPDDKGFRFALVCVDINTGYTDAEPIKERIYGDAESTLKAYKKITAREPLKDAPRYVLGEANLRVYSIPLLLKRG